MDLFVFITWFACHLLIAHFIYGLPVFVYIKRCFISIDQSFNTIFCFGYEDETLSCRAYRVAQYGSEWYFKVGMLIIDCIFFWDKKPVTCGDAASGENQSKTKYYKHCELSYMYEKERMHCPPEMREE